MIGGRSTERILDFGMTSNMCVGILGPGLLCMPWAVQKAGIAGAIVLFVVTAWLNLVTTRFLLQRATVNEYADKSSKKQMANVESPLLGKARSSISDEGVHEDSDCMYSSLEEMAGAKIGNVARYITAVAVILFLAGCIVGNMIALQTATHDLFPKTGHFVYPSFIGIIYAISAFSNVEILGKYTSPMGLTALFTVTFALCLRSSFSHSEMVRKDTIMEAFPIATFAFSVQPYALGICANSTNSTSVNDASMVLAFIICFVLYTTVGVVGYATFGDHVAANVLSNFGKKDFMAAFTNACMMLVIISCAPVNIFPVRNAILELARLKKTFGPAYYLTTGFLVFVPYLLAVQGWDMAKVFSVTGNTACIITCYMLPCIVAMMYTSTWYEFIWPSFVFILSLIMSVLAVI